MSEQIALIEFINSRDTGNALREIAERRLCDLVREEIMFQVFYDTTSVIKKRKIPCYKPSTYEKFESISDAARKLGILKDTLTSDLYKGTYNYGVFPISKK